MPGEVTGGRMNVHPSVQFLIFTLQDRCGTAGQSPDPQQGVRSITEEGSTEQIGFIYSIIVLPNIFGSSIPVLGAFLSL